MNNPGKQAARVFTLTGGSIIAITLLLMYQLSEVQSRSETFAFTVAFISLQEVLFFGTLAWNAHSSARNNVALPVRLAYFSTIVLYNCIATITVILFNLVPFFQSTHSNIYYTMALSETGLCFAVIVVLRLVDIAHKHSHFKAEQARSHIDLMLDTCDRIFTFNQIHKWNLAGLVLQLAEGIRFSEGLRRNSQFATELLDLLSELESLIRTGGNEEAEQQAVQLANIILANTHRQR